MMLNRIGPYGISKLCRHKKPDTSKRSVPTQEQRDRICTLSAKTLAAAAAAIAASFSAAALSAAASSWAFFSAAAAACRDRYSR
jgi:hypothetical protein